MLKHLEEVCYSKESSNCIELQSEKLLIIFLSADELSALDGTKHLLCLVMHGCVDLWICFLYAACGEPSLHLEIQNGSDVSN